MFFFCPQHGNIPNILWPVSVSLDKVFESADFHETDWRMAQEFNTIDGEKGSIEIFYTMEFNVENEGPFLKEERDLIQNIAHLITGYINSYKAQGYHSPGTITQGRGRPEECVKQKTASEIS